MKDDSFRDYVLDQLRDFPAVDCRPMFGGYGFYAGKSFFGILFKKQLYFKVSSTTLPDYQRAGAKPFCPSAKQEMKSYYEVPADVLERSDELCAWAGRAVAAAIGKKR